jgi:oxygen-independent coproporphyrinogen III oxidase
MFVYLHVPFCASHCIYCDFYVVLEKHAQAFGGQQAFLDALILEIHSRLTTLASDKPLTPIKTLYVGGGTPSLLSPDAYKTLFKAFKAHTAFETTAEITLEVNPNDLHFPVSDYREAGFNRVSVGIQSLQPAELKKLSRRHTPEQAMACVRTLQAGGFDNISIDLMYGIPEQRIDSWRDTLKRAIALNVQHISMYGLQLEVGTPLATLVEKNAYTIPEDEQTVAMYFEALTTLETAGFHRYEFSNLAQPGYESRHNLSYWHQQESVAFGPSATGYVNHNRYKNVADLKTYLADPLQSTSHHVSVQEKLENTLIFGLRMAKGVHIPTVEATFGIDFRKEYGQALLKHMDTGYLEWENNWLKLPVKAIPVSNTILAEFIQSL